jgi:16S rRNA (adenine1518-N6/adenine1519-N6)-dimethyltransferase
LLLTDVLESKHRFAAEVMEAVQSRLERRPGRSLKLVANLPYCVATPVVSNLVASDLPWRLMIVSIQWELAQRMRAEPGSNDYGALSVWLQAQCDVSVLRKLPPQVFWPRPQVDSAIVRLLPDTARRSALGDRAFFHALIRRLFTQRRKSLRSGLAGILDRQFEKPQIDALLESMRLPVGIRAEQLDVSTLVRLAGAVRERLTMDPASVFGQNRRAKDRNSNA